MANIEQKNDAFDLFDLLQNIKRSIILIVCATFLSGVLGFCISEFFIKSEYESVVTMIVNTKQDNSSTITNDNIQSAQKLVSTYSFIIKSNTVLNQVISNLDLDVSYSELSKHVYVDTVDDTQIIRVAVRDTDRELAEKIVMQISQVAPDIIVDNVEAGSCKVISQIETSSSPVTPNVLKDALIGAAIGFVISIFGVVVFAFVKEKRIVDEGDIQRYLDIPVLGVIPKVEGDLNEKIKI